VLVSSRVPRQGFKEQFRAKSNIDREASDRSLRKLLQYCLDKGSIESPPNQVETIFLHGSFDCLIYVQIISKYI
jgi:hypothetical protein